MSGFRSGFGGGGGFGGGFGANNNPFGGGQQQQPPFGGSNSQPQQQQPSFGYKSNPFGNSGFSAAAPTFGSPPNASTFGQTTGGVINFGSSPNVVQQFGAQGFSTGVVGQSSTFGQSPTSSGFGSTSFAAPTSTFPFGAAPPTSQNNNLFGSNTATNQVMYGGGGAGLAQASSNPFGNTAPTVTFGMSSNVVAETHDDSEMSQSPTPYGNFAPNHGMQDPHDGAPSVFGTPSTNIEVTAVQTPWPSKSSGPFGGGNSSRNNQRQGLGGLSPIPESADDTTGQEEGDSDKLAELKARIEEKKRKLLEQKRRKETLAASHRTGTPDLAQRNALRFGSNNNNNASETTRAHLPADIVQNESSTAVSSNIRSSIPGGAPSEREHLSEAVSLVGTCMYMCPDEELLRRQREGDIQLLEIPRPGELHPPSWTLRDTVVKRFRRSAADFKLDVPEWVRPPDVLEKVVGYLEEWVMERDRQGPDSRFPNNGTPQPLDVYQFIWDRTRMVRKDFVLQNYIGTGGNCDARAVRCHERMARWHAMCEHQLSHIPDFVTMQSQQNIQELGQTMKTLNQYYDDSLNRSMVEVSDDEGHETRTDLSGFEHGCVSDIVQGNNPVDYDGTELQNTASAEILSLRLIGKAGVSSPNRGTAEPEMRALYILLTIENDGGMEVLKYAARLFQQRPAIYHSKPVQLALNIYKARKEYNYARFFSILRSPDTPYLFSCIMFKHVEFMRKLAFRIMSKTYGGRSKDSNEPIYDTYPLKSLLRLLCFESLEEARQACEHYGITVKPIKVRTATGVSVEDIIFWRNSNFKEPKDSEKSTLIPLPPLKMLKTIESKLHGATRLAVCRGQVSGEGSCLSSSDGSAPQAVQLSPNQIEQRIEAMRAARREAERQQQEMEDRKHRDEIEKTKRLVEQERQEAEWKRQAELERQWLEEERKNRELAIREQEDREEKVRLEQLRIEQERVLRRKQEADRRSAEDARLRLLEQERLEKQRLKEFERKRLADEEERRRIEEEKVKAEVEARRLKSEEEERQRQAMKRERELELRRDQEKRSQDKLWNEKTEMARKQIIWKIWLRKCPRHSEMLSRSSFRLSNLSSIVPSPRTPAIRQTSSGRGECRVSESERWDMRRSVEALIRVGGSRIDLADRVLRRRRHGTANSVINLNPQKATLLFTISLVVPRFVDIRLESLSDLLRSWVGFRVGFGVSSAADASGRTDIRVAFIDGNSQEQDIAPDAVFVVVPYPDCQADDQASFAGSISRLVDGMDKSIPTVVLAISGEKSSIMTNLPLSSLERAVVVDGNYSDPVNLNESLESACDHLAAALLIEAAIVVDKVPIMSMGLVFANFLVSYDDYFETREDLLWHIQEGLRCLVDELDDYGSELRESCLWPSKAFARNAFTVPNYFSDGDLPLSWTRMLLRPNVEPDIKELSTLLSGSYRGVLDYLLFDAPVEVKRESIFLLDKRQFRRCLQHAIMWRQRNVEIEAGESCLYLVRGSVQTILTNALARFLNRFRAESDLRRDASVGEWGADPDFHETIDAPPVEQSPFKDFRTLPTKRMREEPPPPGIDENLSETIEVDAARPQKRTRRGGQVKALSEDQKVSRAFSKKLEMLAAGGTKEMLVGGRPLSALLQGVAILSSVVPEGD